MEPVQFVIALAIALVLAAVLALYGFLAVGFVQDWALAKRPGHPARRMAEWLNRRAEGRERRVVEAAKSLHQGAGASIHK